MGYLKQVRGMTALGKSAEDICQEMGITLQVYLRWMNIEHSRKIRHLERENISLKEMLHAAHGGMAQSNGVTHVPS